MENKKSNKYIDTCKDNSFEMCFRSNWKRLKMHFKYTPDFNFYTV